MTRQQFENALALAKDKSQDLNGEDISVFIGYGSPEFEPVICKMKTVAAGLRHGGLLTAVETHPNILENFFKKCEHKVFVVD